MAKRTVEESSLTAVADAIRERAGTSEPLVFPEGFKSAVEGIPHLEDAIIERTLRGEYRNERITKLGSSCFANCGLLKNVFVPNVTTFGGFAFQNCWELRMLDCKAETVDAAFQNSVSFDTLILRGDSVATLTSASVFNPTKIGSGNGYVYVKRALLSDTDESKDYRRATNWSAIASQIRAIEDYPEITGGAV